MITLTNDSNIILEELIKFIKNNKKEFVFNNKSNLEYNDLLKYIYNIFKSFIKNYKNHNINIDSIKYKSTNKNFYKYYENIIKKYLINGEYIFQEVKNYVQNKNNIEIIKYYIKYNTYNFNIDFINYLDNNNRLSDENIKNYIEIILIIFDLLLNLTKNRLKCGTIQFNIYIFLTPFKKQLNKNIYNDNNYDTIINTKNVNTGYCYGCNKECNIILYRQEDFLKTLIHELLHTLGIDKFIYENLNIDTENKLIKQIFNVEDNNNLGYGINESYVEFWANFLNICVYSFLTTNNYKVFFDNVNILTKMEQIHSFVQTVKILNYNNIQYKDIINFKKNNIYKENTHILSYYIIKSILLYNIYDFIKFIKCCTKDIIFENNYNNIEKFINYISKISVDDNILNNLNIIHNYFVQNNNLNTLFKTNLKMVFIEYKV